MDDISDIAKHYNSDPELEDDRLHRHPMELARMGYAVTALDLSEQLLKLCDTRVAARHNWEWL